jgi:lysylphosphatidylglycerol synthetase-like protein (DUF2156 family)
MLFGIRLKNWSPTSPSSDSTGGTCYNPKLVAHPGARHPFVDDLYLGVTCFFFFMAAFGAIFSNLYPKSAKDANTLHPRYWLVFLALAQFPVHVYMAAALRTKNKAEKDVEGQWGYGQVVAILTLLGTFVECGRGILSEFFVFFHAQYGIR